MGFFGNVLTVVDSPANASATSAVLSAQLDRIDRVTALYVVEHERSELPRVTVPRFLADADDALSVVESELEDDLPVEKRTVFDPNVAPVVFDTTLDSNADTIVLCLERSERLTTHLETAGAETILTNSQVPVIVFPDRGSHGRGR